MARKSALAKDPPRKQQKPAPQPPPPPQRQAPPPAQRQEPPPAQKQEPPPPQRQEQKPQTNNKKQELSAPARPENKLIFEGMSPEQQQRYLRLRRNKGLEAANKYMTSVTGKTPTGPGGRQRTAEEKKNAPQGPQGPANEPPPDVPFEQLDPGQQMGEMADRGGNIYNTMAGYAESFDPNTFQAQYDPVFSQEMERARQNVLSQFDRRNKQQFEQQRLSMQQQIAERGLDPASPAAQEMMRQQNERETLAQQEAMSAAEQAAQGVQQQMFNQATGTAMLPGQIMQPFMDPVMAQYGNFAQSGQLAQQQGYAKELAGLEHKFGMQRMKAMPRGGGGGGAAPDPYAAMDQYVASQMMSGYGPSQPKPNPIAVGAQGVVSGAAGAGMNAIKR